MSSWDPISATSFVTLDQEMLLPAGPRAERLDTDDARRLDAIRAEFAMGFEALRDVTKGVSIFGSARTPRDHPEYALARAAGAAFGRKGFTVITGGGPGIMEAANRGAREVGARSVGCNIVLPFEQAPNPYQDISLEFHHFYARKVMFVRYASAFVVFPGGFGTLDELFESLTLIQTSTIAHFPVVLVGAAYWSGLVEWVRRELVGGGKVEAAELDMLSLTDDADEVVAIVAEAHRQQSEITERCR